MAHLNPGKKSRASRKEKKEQSFSNGSSSNREIAEPKFGENLENCIERETKK
jgi:hypothetical protein